MMRWAVSTVTSASSKPVKKEDMSVEEEEVKKVVPKKLKKASDVDETEE